ncbi:cytochrome c oxidase subunit 3 [Halopseudomonas pelagia]|uniref:cytochrome c oxidase subunit 3 n=1 Tax=Halopseudomonas pelagia TaxID=553151 RepID=UPI0003AB3A32|nr:cytochrome c oxidase subunit 3 [Halopseudomonas pelagia]|tara:strand:+ start:70433 stop:71038 length:606 start_codon:yes stop_codon:yes gene_type:complete
MTAMQRLPIVHSTVAARELPGDLAMWCFILAELAVFALLLGSMAYVRGRWPEMFSAGVATLHPLAGLVNTLALLTGSYWVAKGVAALRQGRSAQVAWWFRAGAASGLFYLVVKGLEYQQMFSAGYNLRTNTFYFFYFFTTFFHLMHVVLGMVILLVVAARFQRGAYPSGATRQMAAESAASYWHMVDLVWLMLFPLLYVLP